VVGLTQAELEAFVKRCLDKYEAKRVDPGGVVVVGPAVIHRVSLWGVYV
jgi:hypothetical protein